MDKNSYALGMSIAHNMMQSGIKSIEFDDFAAGVKAVLTGSEPAVSFQEAGQLLDKYFAEIEAEQKAEAEAMGAAMREEGEVFLKMNAEKEGVVVLPSGLQYKVITEGTGKKPSATSQVKCHYEGTLLKLSVSVLYENLILCLDLIYKCFHCVKILVNVKRLASKLSKDIENL